ncbi:HPr kinase/phosphorylase [Phyllobacterium salinisoli]|uniref:HPr kinase/phosphorylase n=1 Tax=Phyllobacterium salinisoli TaxID=1899321 RepID=A0A368K1P9_9HYPH|nr:HPr kinase/phosphatase C-terminal domain-containing protein [Phyllobacterium salinisoli]RCS22322.1 HPr kinase/phosphorylase [Phyllobacterium salinisoli]
MAGGIGENGNFQNVHATSLLVADRGVLITGASGAGKSALAFALIAMQRSAGRFAALVSDDRTVLRAANGRLLASPPETLAGGIEIRGAGLFAMAHEKTAIIHLLVDLAPPEEAVRYPDGAQRALCGIKLPLLVLPAQQSESLAAGRAVEAALFMPPWPFG